MIVEGIQYRGVVWVTVHPGSQSSQYPLNPLQTNVMKLLISFLLITVLISLVNSRGGGPGGGGGGRGGGRGWGGGRCSSRGGGSRSYSSPAGGRKSSLKKTLKRAAIVGAVVYGAGQVTEDLGEV